MTDRTATRARGRPPLFRDGLPGWMLGACLTAAIGLPLLLGADLFQVMLGIIALTVAAYIVICVAGMVQSLRHGMSRRGRR